MVEEIGDFTAWWDANVGVRESPGRSKSNADQRSIISKDKAEEQTLRPSVVGSSSVTFGHSQT
jgi:hypothetical protein